jgi:hypothetical protein
MEKIEKSFNQKAFTMGIGAAITGILVTVLGLGVMMIRVRLAVVFLGARTLFDTPFNNDDAMKIGMVMLVALVITVAGLVLFGGGTMISLIQFSRKKNI